MRKALAFLLLAVLLIAAAAGCGSQEQPKAAVPPDKVLSSFLDALKKKDTDKMYDLISEKDKNVITDEEWDAIEKSVEGPAGAGAFTYKILDTDTEPKYAVVGVELSQGGEVENTSFIMVKEGGEWKLSLQLSDSLQDE